MVAKHCSKCGREILPQAQSHAGPGGLCLVCKFKAQSDVFGAHSTKKEEND